MLREEAMVELKIIEIPQHIYKPYGRKTYVTHTEHKKNISENLEQH